MWLVATHKDYLRRHLVSELIEKSVINAKKMGFKYAIAECTSDSSINAFKGHGFKVWNTVEYKNFEFPKNSGKFPLKQFEDSVNRTKLCLVVMELEEKNEENLPAFTTCEQCSIL